MCNVHNCNDRDGGTAVPHARVGVLVHQLQPSNDRGPNLVYVPGSKCSEIEDGSSQRAVMHDTSPHAAIVCTLTQTHRSDPAAYRDPGISFARHRHRNPPLSSLSLPRRPPNPTVGGYLATRFSVVHLPPALSRPHFPSKLTSVRNRTGRVDPIREVTHNTPAEV